MTPIQLKIGCLSMVIVGMEWTFHFWRKLRDEPVSTILSDVDSAIQMVQQRNLLILGSAAGAAAVLYGSIALLYFGWEAERVSDLLTRWGGLTSADWTRFSGRAVPGIAIWGMSAAWLSERVHHPFFPACVARFAGIVARMAVACACIWVLRACYLDFNHNLPGGLIGFAALATVSVSTWTGAVGRWRPRAELEEEDPQLTTASDYPFSYVCLCTFFLIFGYAFLIGSPTK